MFTYDLNDGIPLCGVDLDLLFVGANGEEADGSFVPAYDIWTKGRTAWIKATPAQLRDRISQVCADFDKFVSQYSAPLTKEAFKDAAELFVDVYEDSGSTEVLVSSRQ